MSTELIGGVEPQPLLAQARRISAALAYIGNPLSMKETAQLEALGLEEMTEETVTAIRKACIAKLDFHFEREEIDAMGKDGMAALDNGYADGVVEILRLFEEILNYTVLPRRLAVPHCRMAGAAHTKTSGEAAYGPIIVYNMMHNKLRYVDELIGVNDKARIEALHAIVRGDMDAALEGPAVFEKMTTMFLERAATEEGRFQLRST